MGATQSKQAARKAKYRYAARDLPRPNKEVAEEFKKAKKTIEGVNSMKAKAANVPQPFVETKLNAESFMTHHQTAPKWWMNTWSELVDSAREDLNVVSGNLPGAWERDKMEPYALVRNRIDNEDLFWLLSEENKTKPLDVLVEQTKLDREAIKNILESVELPRTQYRNYKGKINRVMDDPNTYLKDRKAKIEKSRNEELLRNIGFTDEEIEDDQQYLTKRSRGVKTLDELGVSIREKKRRDRIADFSDMEYMLKEREIAQIEDGEFVPEESDIETVKVEQLLYKNRRRTDKRGEFYAYRLDMDHPSQRHRLQKMQWAIKQKMKIPYGEDKIVEGMPQYAEHLSQSSEKLEEEFERSSDMQKKLGKGQGAKHFSDPKEGYDDMRRILRMQGRLYQTPEAKAKDMMNPTETSQVARPPRVEPEKGDE